MGILDDAIREHLELKRRAGADPGEISRLEREAFGAQEAASAAPPEPGDEGGGVAVRESESEAPPAEREAEREVDPAAAIERFSPEPVLEPPREPEPSPLDEELDQPTRQFTAQERDEAERGHEPPPAPAPADDGGEHDELEETPDFLQETPEHDRLWFEQKPPKDFDF